MTDFYSISFRSSADKDLRALSKKLVSRVVEKLEGLREEPFPREAVKLSGVERLYRVRVGDYRIVYEVDTQEKQIIIYYIRHRREIYRAL